MNKQSAYFHILIPTQAHYKENAPHSHIARPFEGDQTEKNRHRKCKNELWKEDQYTNWYEDGSLTSHAQTNIYMNRTFTKI